MGETHVQRLGCESRAGEKLVGADRRGRRAGGRGLGAWLARWPLSSRFPGVEDALMNERQLVDHGRREHERV